MHDTHLTITALILLLLIASGVAMITKWVQVPYTVALVVVGLVTCQLHFLPAIHISPELILLIFLPALLFEASWNLDLKKPFDSHRFFGSRSSVSLYRWESSERSCITASA